VPLRTIPQTCRGIVRRLTAAGGDELDADALMAGLHLGERAPADRPYTIVNFAASADGRATVDGQSGGLGGAADRRVFRALRSAADGVMAGTGTLRAESYGRLVKDPARRDARVARGLAPEPLACTVTRGGRLPTAIPLWAEPEARVIVFSGAVIEDFGARAQLEVVRMDPAELTMAAALAHLRGHDGVQLLLCEGGPGLFTALLRERLVDELYLTVAPKLVAGESLALTAGDGLDPPAGLALEWVLEEAGSLFLRYAVRN